MDSAELLAQLRDIHLPEPVSLWPPAPGWWLLGALLLAALVFGCVHAWRQYRRRKICSFALAELERCYIALEEALNADEDADTVRVNFINEVNAVLRRVALWHFPHSHVASLGGKAWVDFIREKGDSSEMTDEIAQALGQGRFQARCEYDIAQLVSLGRRWVTSLYMQAREASATPGKGVIHRR
ncbi:MAG: DUF4381 domain-containing protein [Pseudohongiellaceae bacterium]